MLVTFLSDQLVTFLSDQLVTFLSDQLVTFVKTVVVDLFQNESGCGHFILEKSFRRMATKPNINTPSTKTFSMISTTDAVIDVHNTEDIPKNIYEWAHECKCLINVDDYVLTNILNRATDLLDNITKSLNILKENVKDEVDSKTIWKNVEKYIEKLNDDVEKGNAY